MRSPVQKSLVVIKPVWVLIREIIERSIRVNYAVDIVAWKENSNVNFLNFGPHICYLKCEAIQMRLVILNVIEKIVNRVKDM